jgi:hypothetical protein
MRENESRAATCHRPVSAAIGIAASLRAISGPPFEGASFPRRRYRPAEFGGSGEQIAG